MTALDKASFQLQNIILFYMLNIQAIFVDK